MMVACAISFPEAMTKMIFFVTIRIEACSKKSTGKMLDCYNIVIALFIFDRKLLSMCMSIAGEEVSPGSYFFFTSIATLLFFCRPSGLSDPSGLTLAAIGFTSP